MEKRLSGCLAAVAVKSWEVVILGGVRKGGMEAGSGAAGQSEFTRHPLNTASNWNLGRFMLLLLKWDQSSADDMGVQSHIFAAEWDDFAFGQVFTVRGLYAPYLCTVFAYIHKWSPEPGCLGKQLNWFTPFCLSTEAEQLLRTRPG